MTRFILSAKHVFCYDSAMKKLKEIYLITGLFLLPVMLIYLKVIPFQYIRLVLFIFVLITVWLVKRENWGLKKLGLRTDNLLRLLPIYMVFTLIGIMAIYLLTKIFGINHIPDWTKNSHLLFWFIPISIAQEFIFRGYYLTKLKTIFSSSVMAILINVIVFAVMHIIYPNAIFALLIGAVSGIAFATIYYYRPNLILVSVAHAILNFFAVYYCFFGC